MDLIIWKFLSNKLFSKLSCCLSITQMINCNIWVAFLSETCLCAHADGYIVVVHDLLGLCLHRRWTSCVWKDCKLMSNCDRSEPLPGPPRTARTRTKGTWPTTGPASAAAAAPTGTAATAGVGRATLQVGASRDTCAAQGALLLSWLLGKDWT